MIKLSVYAFGMLGPIKDMFYSISRIIHIVPEKQFVCVCGAMCWL